MDEDATWYGSIDIGAGHIVLDGFPALRERGTAPLPLLGPCLLWPRSPMQLLLSSCLFFQDGGRLPSWICYSRIRSTREGHLVEILSVYKIWLESL